MAGSRSGNLSPNANRSPYTHKQPLNPKLIPKYLPGNVAPGLAKPSKMLDLVSKLNPSKPKGTVAGGSKPIGSTGKPPGPSDIVGPVLPETPAAPKPITGNPADFSHFPLENKGIFGNLDKNGIVEFKINTKGSGIRGTDLFKLMMEHFGGHAKGVKGKWVSGDNWDKVNELTAKGIPLEEAITMTWTANRARDAGFGKATLVKPATGTPGAYTDIEVVFTK